MISLTLIILQVQSLLHLLIFPSVIHHCFLIIIGLYVKTSTIVIISLSSLNRTLFSTEDHNPKWKLNRANLDLLNTLCTGKLIPENSKESSDPISDFTSSLIEISKECIRQTSTNPTKSNPWYNDDCKEAIKQRKEALSKFKRSPNTNNFNDIKVLELKPVEELKFWRSYVLKSIIKHLLESLEYDKKNLWKKQIPQLHTFKQSVY